MPGHVAYEKIQQAISNPEGKYFLSPEQRAQAHLKDLTPTGLTLALLDFCKDNPSINEIRVKNAILMATNLHKDDTRSSRGRYDKTAYIEHPLRNALRATRYGCKDEAIIIGSLFHDVVEDHPFELAEQYGGTETLNEQEARNYSYDYIKKTYGNRVAVMVEGMSNPIIDLYTPAIIKNKIYAEHVETAIENPDVCVGKVCDFVDNAVGLFHNAKGTMDKTGIRKRATKYLPVCDIIEAQLNKQKISNTLPVPVEGIEKMIQHIQEGRKSLKKLVNIV